MTTQKHAGQRGETVKHPANKERLTTMFSPRRLKLSSFCNTLGFLLFVLLSKALTS